MKTIFLALICLFLVMVGYLIGVRDGANSVYREAVQNKAATLEHEGETGELKVIWKKE